VNRGVAKRDVVIAALALTHAVVACVWLHSVRFDDAFISFRYGENLALGRGMVFNVGERVWGATTLLWVLVAAIAHRVVGHATTPAVMACIGCVAWSAQTLIARAVLRRLGFDRAADVAAVFLALGMAESFTWVAMETNLVFDVALAAVLAALCERYCLAAAFAAVAIVGRPDMIVPAALVAALAAGRLRARAWKPLVVGLVMLAPAVLLLWSAGGPLPRSAVVKYGFVGAPAYFVHELAVVPAEILAAMTATTPPTWAAWGGLIVWPIVFLGAAALVRRDRRAAVLPLWAILHLAAYLIWRPLPGQVWHLYAPIAVGVMFFAVGLIEIQSRFAHARLVNRIAAPAVIGAFALLALLRTVAFAKFDQHAVFWFEPRNAAYVSAARIIHASAREGDVVAAGEVGTLAYYSDERVEDWNGLVNEQKPLVAALASGHPGRVRWIVGWAPGDVAYFRKTLVGHAPFVYSFPTQHKSIYVFDLLE